MVVAESGRLIIRHFTLADAPFIVALLNDPAFIANIGDRGIRTLAEAEAYLQNGAIASYAQHGFGLNLVVQKSSGESIGMCGLIRRATLPAVDIGYAFLPAYTGRGYAREAARLIMQTARQRHGLDRLLAIVNPDNDRSIRLLQKLGFDYAGPIRLQPNAEPISQFEASLREQSACFRQKHLDAKFGQDPERCLVDCHDAILREYRHRRKRVAQLPVIDLANAPTRIGPRSLEPLSPDSPYFAHERIALPEGS